MKQGIDPRHLDHLISLGRWTAIAHRLIAGRTYAEFSSNVQFELAVSKAIEMVGEISGRILKSWPVWAAAHPDLELANAYAMRNRLAHGYDGVDLATVWRTVTISIPDMDAVVLGLLADLDPGDDT